MKRRKVLEVLDELSKEDWLDGDCYFGFKTISKASGLDHKEARRIVRHLARHNLAEYAKGLMTEDGEVAGSGYRITKTGRERLKNDQQSE
jgi:hypothetical protein